MGLTSCPGCGANVNVARDVSTNEIIVLEVNTDASSDAARYRIVSYGPPHLLVERVPDDAAGDFYALHDFDCPDANAGRTF